MSTTTLHRVRKDDPLLVTWEVRTDGYPVGIVSRQDVRAAAWTAWRYWWGDEPPELWLLRDNADGTGQLGWDEVCHYLGTAATRPEAVAYVVAP